MAAFSAGDGYALNTHKRRNFTVILRFQVYVHYLVMMTFNFDGAGD